jgi:hypothetical protein
VHVIQLLYSLLPAPHVEIVEPSLPKTPRHCSSLVSPQRQLIRIPTPAFSSQRSRDALLQRLHHHRGIPHLRLRNQQVNVFRHHHVASQRELVTRPHFVENLQENVALPGCSQQRASPVTTARDEMQMALPIPALQSVFQSHHSKPAPFANPAKSAAPAKESSKSQSTANHFSVNYLSGIIHIRYGSRRRKCTAMRKDGPPAPQRTTS